MLGKDRARRRRYLRLVLAGMAAVCLVVLTACSSGSGSSTGTSGGTSGTAAASAAATLKGTPLNVMTIASVDYNGPTYANILSTAQVAGDWINAHGGIDGHPVNVTTCDEQGIPTKTAQCGRQAIQDHDVAVVGSFSLNGSAIIPELAAAHVSWFGICCAVSADENTSPDVQQIGSGLALTPAIAVKMVEDGCKNVAMVLGDDGALATFTETLFNNALKSVGASKLPVKVVLVPLTAQDYSPQVAKATAGTDCIFADLGEANFPSFMPAFVQSGAHQRLYGAQGNLDITVTKPNPAATQNAVIAGSYSDISLPAWPISGRRSRSTRRRTSTTTVWRGWAPGLPSWSSRRSPRASAARSPTPRSWRRPRRQPWTSRAWCRRSASPTSSPGWAASS